LAPDYERPEVPVPEGWRDIDEVQQHRWPTWAGGAVPGSHLVSLIQIAPEENKDLKIATERIEEVRPLRLHARGPLPDFNAYGSARGLQNERGRARAARRDRESNLYAVGASAFWERDSGRVRRASENEPAIPLRPSSRSAVVLALVARPAPTSSW
jgi:outer membrane protein TolC